MKGVPFLNNVTYLGFTFDMETPYRKDRSQGLAHVRTYSQLKTEPLSTNINLKLYRTLIRSHLGLCGGRSPLGIAAPVEQCTRRYWKS
jgi:hypothetical protein